MFKLSDQPCNSGLITLQLLFIMPKTENHLIQQLEPFYFRYVMNNFQIKIEFDLRQVVVNPFLNIMSAFLTITKFQWIIGKERGELI